MGAGRYAIQASGVSAGYGDVTVLSALSVAIPHRETTGIVGPGGSGKSTLLRALGRTEAQAPEQFWCREERYAYSGAMGFLPQRPRRSSNSLRELLSNDGRDPASAIQVIDECWACAPDAAECLKRELETPLDEAPFEVVRLAEITLVITSGRPLLLLDEPEAELHDEGRDWVASKLRELKGERTVVLVTHHLKFARSVAHSLMLLVNGEVLEEGETERVFNCPSHPRTEQYLRMGS